MTLEVRTEQLRLSYRRPSRNSCWHGRLPVNANGWTVHYCERPAHLSGNFMRIAETTAADREGLTTLL